MKIVVCFFLMFYVVTAYCQNVYDSLHIKAFADYLSATQQYQFAAEEYQKINLVDLSVDNYLLAKNNKMALQTFESNVFNINNLTPKKQLFYVKLLTLNQNYAKAYSVAENIKEPYTVRAANICALLPLVDNSINRNFTVEKPELFSQETEELLRYKPDKKNVALGTIMSAIVPGSGKIYSKNYYDGIVTMIMLGLDAFHIARGFNKYGCDVYPIFFTFFGVSFYAGNIFGTAKAIKKYNKNQKQLHDEKIIGYLNNFVF